MTSKLFIAGVGCSSAASATEIVSLIAACCAEAGIATSDLVALATHVRKRGSFALRHAASQLALPLRFLAEDDLLSDGVCEAAAAVAGPLILPKRKSAYATCAIARCAPGFVLSRFGQADSSSAAIASSTEATSWAGP